MAKFLLLQTRPEADAAQAEYESFCQLGGMDTNDVERLDITTQHPLPHVDLHNYNAILMGGGPACFSYDDAHKSDMQRRMEPWLFELFDRIVAEDKPFFGVCLGTGLFAVRLGGAVSFDITEPAGAASVVITDEGQHDPLLAGVPDNFLAIVGHKEGIVIEPPRASILARSAVCPQLLRCKSNIYAAQFHPELDVNAFNARLTIYQHHGYCDPSEVAGIIAKARTQDLSHAPKILKNFIKRYAK